MVRHRAQFHLELLQKRRRGSIGGNSQDASDQIETAFCFALFAKGVGLVQDIPPFMIADGNPAKVRGINLVGLERSGFPPESVKWIKEAFRLIYRS